MLLLAVILIRQGRNVLRKTLLSGRAIQFSSPAICLARDYVSRTCAALLALSHGKFDFLAFGKTGVAAHFDFRVMNEDVLVTGIGCDKPEALLLIKPFHCTCTHL